MTSLVIGNGLVGKAIANRIQKQCERVIVASRTECNNPDYIYLDLKNLAKWDVPCGVDVAYFCAGVTSKYSCMQDYEGCRLINVENTLKVIYSLLDKNIFVVFLSSVDVFDGEKPYYNLIDDTNPASLYGELKLEVEKVLENNQSCSIVRLTKVLGSETNLIKGWVHLFFNGKSVAAFDDVYISPVSVSYAVDFIYSLGCNKLNGIYHLSGKGNYTYLEISSLIATRIRGDDQLVRGEKSDKNIPHFASLDMSGNSSIAAFQPQDISNVIDDLLI